MKQFQRSRKSIYSFYIIHDKFIFRNSSSVTVTKLTDLDGYKIDNSARKVYGSLAPKTTEEIAEAHSLLANAFIEGCFSANSLSNPIVRAGFVAMLPYPDYCPIPQKDCMRALMVEKCAKSHNMVL